MSSALAIKASGMVTAVGLSAPASLAAIRARLRNVNVTNLWDKHSGKFLAAGRVPLPHWWIGIGKLAELVAPAINECLTAAQPVPRHEIPVLLGVSSPDRPCRLPGLDQHILGEVQDRLACQLHRGSLVIRRDHVSIAAGLRLAEELIRQQQAPCCIVAGVDSLVQQDLVEYYLDRRRLLTERNSNGFCVGEAGSAVLVAPAGQDSVGELQILGIGIAREKATIESEEPLQAEGLIQAIRGAFGASATGYEDVQYRITDLNGEHYKFKEMALAMVRFQGKPKGKLFDLWHPAEYIGDVGAAIGPIVLGLALHAGQKGYGNGPTVLCTFGNDDGERAAMVVRYRSKQGQQ
jgi:3-oxoacyl-[acyl-carrier-protein] synthase-1